MNQDEASFSHLGICVADLDKSMRFYCDGLGFEDADGFDLDDTAMPGLAEALEVESPVKVRSQWIQKGALRIELLAYDTPSPVGVPSATRRQLGVTHLAFNVEDADAVAARLAASGGTVLEHTSAALGVNVLFVADPDGTRIELMSP